MNTKINTIKLPVIAVLGAGVVVGISGMASAAPGRDVQQARQEVKETKREVKEERHDVRQANTPAERRDAKADLRDARDDHRDAKQDLRHEKQEQRFDNRQPNWNQPNRNQPGWNNRPDYSHTYNQPAYNAPRYNGGYRPANNFDTFTGVVTSVKSNQRFTIRVGGQLFDVISDNNLSRRINSGDVVRVSGERDNGNIENATVVLINNR